MSKPFSLILDVQAHDGALEAIQSTVSDLVQDVHDNEPGTVSYNCYVDDASGRVCFLDTYASSEALVEHLGREPVGQALATIMENSTTNQLTLFGDVTPECAEAVAPLGARIMPHHAGFERTPVTA